MTPGLDWRAEYATRPEALAKLEYCDRAVQALLDRDPVVVDDELDEDVGELEYSIGQFYRDLAEGEARIAVNLDTMLRSIFPASTDWNDAAQSSPASGLIRRLEGDLLGNIYRWTGHFPERTRVLVQHLAARGEILGLTYRESDEAAATVALTTLVTSLAMNYVQSGSYLR